MVEGKSSDAVAPATYKCPLRSTAREFATSSFTPPRKVVHSGEPSAAIFATNASFEIRRTTYRSHPPAITLVTLVGDGIDVQVEPPSALAVNVPPTAIPKIPPAEHDCGRTAIYGAKPGLVYTSAFETLSQTKPALLLRHKPSTVPA
jgi:hypothetical protein